MFCDTQDCTELQKLMIFSSFMINSITTASTCKISIAHYHDNDLRSMGLNSIGCTGYLSYFNCVTLIEKPKKQKLKHLGLLRKTF